MVWWTWLGYEIVLNFLFMLQEMVECAGYELGSIDDSDSESPSKYVRCNEWTIFMIDDMKKMVSYQPVTALCNYDMIITLNAPANAGVTAFVR